MFLHCIMNCSCRVMPLGNFSSLSPTRRNELLAAAKDLEAVVVTLAEAISSAPEGSRCLLVPLLTSAQGEVARVAETLQGFARGESGKDGLGTPVLSDPGGSTHSTTVEQRVSEKLMPLQDWQQSHPLASPEDEGLNVVTEKGMQFVVVRHKCTWRRMQEDKKKLTTVVNNGEEPSRTARDYRLAMAEWEGCTHAASVMRSAPGKGLGPGDPGTPTSGTARAASTRTIRSNTTSTRTRGGGKNSRSPSPRPRWRSPGTPRC